MESFCWSASDGSHGVELWRADGSNENTIQYDLNLRFDSSQNRALAVSAGAGGP
ncbi:hypothetical protein G3I17_35240 [Streptomyces sp. SID13031]|nr:hypothetical protein [Streptomyces sp. SID13031]